MLDIAVAYNRYQFLGHEFLLWLWFLIENEEKMPEFLEPDFHSFSIGNKIVLENRTGTGIEKITIKGDDPGLEEALLALRKGAVLRELNLKFKVGDHRWQFTIKAENFILSSIKLPPSGRIETKEDFEGAVLERIFLIDRVFLCIDTLYQHFLHIRISDSWKNTTVHQIKVWLGPL